MNTKTTPKPPIQSNTLPDDDPRSQANIDRRKRLKIVERLPNGTLLPGSTFPNAGRTVGSVTVTALAKRHTERAVNVLVEIMDDPKAPQAARATCAQALLERGWGKAPVQIDLTARARFDDFLRDVGKTAEANRAAAIAVAAATVDMVDVDESDGASED